MKAQIELKGFTPLLDSLVKKYGLITAAVYGAMWRYAQQEDRECWVSGETIAQRLNLSYRTIIRHLKELVKDGYIIIEQNSISPCEAVEMLKTKAPQYIHGSTVACSWCKATTFKLQSHHFPVSAKNGGIDTVKICANCHLEYHYLIDQISYRLGKPVPICQEVIE